MMHCSVLEPDVFFLCLTVFSMVSGLEISLDNEQQKVSQLLALLAFMISQYMCLRFLCFLMTLSSRLEQISLSVKLSLVSVN